LALVGRMPPGWFAASLLKRLSDRNSRDEAVNNRWVHGFLFFGPAVHFEYAIID
jgi:hypothetical protein